MGKPKQAQAALINTDYNWGDFGSADANGVNLSPMASNTIRGAQGGIAQYLSELANPSYSNSSFMARQNMYDANNQEYARQLAQNAIARGSRGSVAQNILNSLNANANNARRNAMVNESERLQNILSALGSVEGNYFNQANILANNILSRQQGNQQLQDIINQQNANAYNNWQANVLSGGASLAGTLAGSYLGSGSGTNTATPYGNAIDPNQVASANNMIG